MISVNNLSLYYGGQDILKEISFMCNKGDKIGLVGKNGAGKTTLLNLLSLNEFPNEGEVISSKDLVVGYLKQDLDFENDGSVIQEVEKAFEDINAIQNNIDQLTKELNRRNDYESQEYLGIISDLHLLNEQFRIHGGNDRYTEITQVLNGLGFLDNDFNRLTSEFSGGWRMRIELAKILLKNPDLLLLDEPTNHLDIESIIWLEKWLKKYTGAIILVSHDRLFLDSVTNRTIEIAFCKINNYKASYTDYLALRKQRIEKQIQAKKNQDKFIDETKILINKFRAKKNKAAFAQTLIKKLERLEKIEVEKEDFAEMSVKFPPAPHSGKLTVLVENASKSYDTIDVLQNVNFQLIKGEKVAFVGKNGAGKTTLAKMISNEIPFQGKINLGYQVKIGYYAQDQANYLDDNKTIFQTIQDSSDSQSDQHIRSILGAFLFSNDDIDKKIKVLSGGERARVSLCKLLLEPYNLLIMDEPTNHLDIQSKSILKKALSDYNGSLILVSHDRDFLKGLTEKVYQFQNQNIKEYIGDIDTFLSSNDFFTTKDSEKTNQNINHRKDVKERKEKKKLKNRINKLERLIADLETSQALIEKKLENPIFSADLLKDKDFFNEYKQKQDKLKDMVKEWEDLVEKFSLLDS